MIEWDDFYQSQKSKGAESHIGRLLSTYKCETEAFYRDWKKAEAKFLLNNPTVWNESED